MGDAADDLYNSSYYYEFEDENLHTENQWRDATGKLWNMSDMTESHIKNCIKHCARLGNTEKVREFQKELARRNISEDNGYQDFLRRVGDIE